MKLKQAFTMVEITLMIVVIGILIVATSITYSNYVTRSRADQTRRLAEEVIQKMEIYKSEHSAYPGELGSETDSGSLISSLSSETRQRIELGHANPPSANHHQGLKLLFCHRPGDVDTPVGAQVQFWDNANQALKTLQFGNSEETGVICL